jgi:hypothetical protein
MPEQKKSVNDGIKDFMIYYNENDLQHLGIEPTDPTGLYLLS